MMTRAARRVRPKDTEEPQASTVQSVENDTPVVAANNEIEPSGKSGVETASSSKDGESASTATLGLKIKPIAERKPAEPLNGFDRRTKALDNLEKVAAAINQYAADRGSYPTPSLKSSGGLPVLSWRVAILPELGYSDLYKKFNLQEPWNGPNNKKWLELIPDEFVSPERFDAKTNILAPAGRGYLFEGVKFPKPSSIEDGAENTILLLEADDAFAVPWTQPSDFSSRHREIKTGMGGLRGDGTYAVWANGWPVLLANQLSWEQLHNAFTWESGDGQLAVTVHRPIAIAAEAVSPAAGAAEVVAAVVPSVPKESLSQIQPMLEREPVPKQSVVAEASKRLREIFAARMNAAKKDEEKILLAKEMLKESDRMHDDSASAFALQGAALKLSSTAGNIETLLECVDMRVSQFNVDAFKENLSALMMFGADNLNRPPKSINGLSYLRRTLLTVFSAIEDDDYDSAGRIVSHSIRFLDQPRDELLPKSLSLLRTQLVSSEREFDLAKQSLASYRANPTDGDSAANFGRFLCFIKGDWETGLPLLGKGGPERLRELAEMEGSGAHTIQDQIQLADAWWSLSESARGEIYRQSTQDRAVLWYSKAFTDMPETLDKLHVKARLDEAGDSGKSSPLALLHFIANEVNVNLMDNLASIGNTSGSKSQATIEPF